MTPLTSATVGGLWHNSRECRIDIVCRGGGFRRLPRRGQTESLFEAQHPGRMGRRQFARAEPGDRTLGRTPTLDHSAVSAHWSA